MVSFGVGIADADLLPGDVVKISDTAYADMRYGGRLAEADTSSVTVDSPVVIEVDKTYAIDVVLPDGTLATRAITNAPGTHTDLTLDTPLPTPPQVNAMWAITASDLAPRLFRVIAVKEADSSHFEVTAVLYDPDKFARVESGLYLPATTFTRLSTDVIPAPTQLNIVEYLYRSGRVSPVGGNRFLAGVGRFESGAVRTRSQAARPGPELPASQIHQRGERRCRQHGRRPVVVPGARLRRAGQRQPVCHHRPTARSPPTPWRPPT